MQAITYHGPHKVAVETVDVPKIIEPTDAIVKITVCGLCGSDLHAYRGDQSGVDKGTIMGHEFVGIIHEIGSEITNLSIGDRVLSPFSTSCSTCYYCERGLTCRCEKGQLYGFLSDGQGIHGAQAEYIRVPLASSTLVKVLPDITDNVALLLGDVLSTGYFCAESGLEHLEVELRQVSVVVIIGCGPVGLMAILSSIFLGVKFVFAIDCIEERLKLAEEFGAAALNFVDCDPVEKIKEVTSGRGADVVLEVVGNPAALQLAFKILRNGGVLSSVGVHNSPTFPFSPNDGYNKNLTYKSGRCPVRKMLTKSIPFALSKQFDFEKIITHSLKLSDGEMAYNIFEKKLDGCIKVVFKI
ncbi:1661_t:CDS:2 [Funneliformis geosporum]|uniref:990_t:CDS:1 n=1 Tax=Funneliformis geosporum TaxID=1117311 RepID=A0A9W4SSQ6_9GLOM|nr:1661_t:CDS:2 [Funneliformis geosporum]CAI2180164.1 990_t:CDS:2 [Funneliformis geosporum]